MPAYKPKHSKGHTTFVAPTWKIQFDPEDDNSWLKTIVVSTRGYDNNGIMREAVVEGEFSSEEEASSFFSKMEAMQWVKINPDFPYARIVYFPGKEYANY